MCDEKKPLYDEPTGVRRVSVDRKMGPLNADSLTGKFQKVLRTSQQGEHAIGGETEVHAVMERAVEANREMIGGMDRVVSNGNEPDASGPVVGYSLHEGARSNERAPASTSSEEPDASRLIAEWNALI